MSFKIEINGLKETSKYLNKKNKDFSNAVTKGLNNAAMYLQGEVKQSVAGRRAEPTSVDTGRFLNSINFQVGKDNAVVFTEIEYAKFLEFGTSRLTPRRHFRNSKDRSKRKITELLNIEIKKA